MTFFRVNNLLNRINCILVHNEFKLLCVPGQLNLDLTNLPRSAKVLGSTWTRTCFSKRNILFQKRIVGQLFAWLSVVDLIVTFWNRFFLLRAFFSNGAFSVWFTPRICIFTNVDFVFPSLSETFWVRFFWPIFYRLNDLVLGRFKGNATWAFPSAFFMKDIFINRFVEIFSFFKMRNYFSHWKNKSHWKSFSFSQKLLLIFKRISIEKMPSPLCACIFPLEPFFDPLVYSLRKSLWGIVWPLFLIFISLSRKIPLSNLSFWY